jgi:hypothetical protein
MPKREINEDQVEEAKDFFCGHGHWSIWGTVCVLGHRKS